MANVRGVAELEIIETKLAEILKNPELFYKSQVGDTTNIKQLSQKTYSAAVCDEIFKGRSLSKLLINGFDEEQIWQQSDLLNKAASSNISDFIRNFNVEDILSVLSSDSSSKSLLSERDYKPFLDNKEDKYEHKDADAFSSQESSAEEDFAFDDDSDSPIESDTKPKSEQLPQRKSEYASVVDDQFFKLSKLENFLRIEDLKEERGADSASDDEINLFEDIPSDGLDVTDDESDDEQCKTKKSSRNLMYEDFFDDPESEIEDESSKVLDDKNGSLMEKNEEYSFDENESDVEVKNVKDEDEQNNNMSQSSVRNAEDKKTKFELEQEKIKKKIQEYEKSMLQPLPWHLTGEIAADKRPVDSLLQQEAEFDSNTKQDLLVDKELTEKIEEITIMAIRNKAFFDVERKYKPTEEVINYKKEISLEQTKSKKSLAEVYEEDYLKKQYKQNTEEEENPKHKEIKKLMDSLLPQLHALFSHIPKPAIPEIKIVSNLPAITVEEVAPTNVSDATLLAPEEVKKKTGLVKSKTERTDTDRKHERRKKKIHQKLKEKKKLQKLETQKENPSAKVSKLEKIQTLKKIKQHKNTKIATIDGGGKIKSSKDFFSRLQDTMDIKNKTKISSKKVKNK